ncbi:rhythmically expressed gene 5 protein isoform X1 [Drosophila kikkawai]|uniref:Rhythmically expressed gene 5 protein isoform X1 n=1 Tax=Drosophila kikkawai TaxID=30033 RepID=A0A6P4IEW8_DROKI|nr:rhythmically expressed gene 5 protein [Drosophila kikkawai]
MTSAAKVILACCLLGAFAMQMSSSSAIPIWEFLTRNEKMSHLYSTFAQLVSVHCKSTVGGGLPVNQCKHNLLGYGSTKLQTLSDAQLEALDPYQRDANELIWSSIMRDHPSGASLVTTRQPIQQQPLPTPPASSLIILTRQQLPQSHSPSQSNSNPLFDNTGEQKHQYAMDMDMAYGYPSRQPAASSELLPMASAFTGEPPKTFLTGPHVVRVRPDGSPVEEDSRRPLPRDEDLPLFRLGLAAAPQAPNRHRKIATISALKQQHFASILQRDLQPPHQVQRRLFRQQQA